MAMESNAAALRAPGSSLKTRLRIGAGFVAGIGAVCLAASNPPPARFTFPKELATDEAARSATLPAIARQVLDVYPRDQNDGSLSGLFRLQMEAGQYAAALETVRGLERRYREEGQSGAILVPDHILAGAKVYEAGGMPLPQALRTASADVLGSLSDQEASEALGWLWAPLGRLRSRFDEALAPHAGSGSTDLSEAANLISLYQLDQEYEVLVPASTALIEDDDRRRYVVDEDVPIGTPEGVTLTATIFRTRTAGLKRPAALNFTIYAGPNAVAMARLAASHGYAGIVAYARGKGLSSDKIVPWEVESRDVNHVIGWIARQPWCDGRVGMFGGSYEGFVQWAALKHPDPALKTIVPWSAVHPGLVLPMSNNVFQNANYAWAFYVTDNRYLDSAIYDNAGRWDTLNRRWYASGRPYREIDQVDGTPNPLLQRQLQHPSFDAYWQALAPFQADFAQIHIPVLQITGYFDPAQIAVLYYLSEHYRYVPAAEHYLVIGPYDHQGTMAAQKPWWVGGYQIDRAADIDTPDLTFAWFDHVMKGTALPAILKDRINYEVMGANLWRHAPSLAAMHSAVLTFYLGATLAGSRHTLESIRPAKPGQVAQEVDLADRASSNNLYPSAVLSNQLSESGCVSYVSDPLDAPVDVAGRISGAVDVVINKQDMDVTFALYEILPDGRFFNLSYYLGRASYAESMENRRLLRPGIPEWIPFAQTPLVCQRLEKGSRLLLLLSVNKNPYAEINYGTGKDVSAESVQDAHGPLRVEWRTDSYIRVPVSR